ncbi:NAD(P)H-dependent oxidoreductase [Actomonas aquatica]|uniref:NAD(P)H-dependent oxidoreductase n=1 Tax=Actomonas aquatica TaxID=2866162 RepID=A0ABZ1C8Z9_9BACT|nr:NAD(P)H-dependent oxidoreductase [Opitutus sp. WL0086]WRQ87830.1 NAD(P)H-dependent oxidoreductase [Opitutus sp. WL0086]
MNPITKETLLDALKWRYATKQFDPAKKIDDATWAALEETLVLAPSSYGLQPWKFIVVEDPAIKAQLVPASYGQTQAADASHFVVFTVRRGLDDAHLDHFIERTAEIRGITPDDLAGFRKVIAGSLAGARQAGFLDAWQEHQIYIALGQLMTAAALLGIDTCPMEGIDKAKFDEILGLTGTDYATGVACAVGYRSADDKYAAVPKVRFPAVEVIERR